MNMMNSGKEIGTLLGAAIGNAGCVRTNAINAALVKPGDLFVCLARGTCRWSRFCETGR